MRNHYLTLFAAVFLASISTAAWSARPLDIITPNGGEVLVKAKKYFIKWNTKGYGKGLNVKLELLVGEKKDVDRVIDKKTKNDGKYEWTVPSDVKFNKKTYSIRIVSVGPSGKRKHEHADISDEMFSISTATWSAQMLEITTPNGGEVLVKAKKYWIKWNTKGYGKNRKVKLLLLKAGKKYKVIKAKTPNSGMYKWKVPSFVDGFGKESFQIQIKSVNRDGKRNGLATDTSDENFTIVKK